MSDHISTSDGAAITNGSTPDGAQETIGATTNLKLTKSTPELKSTPKRHVRKSSGNNETPARGFTTPSSTASSAGFHTPSSSFATPSSMSSTYSTYDGTPLSFSYQDTVASLTPIRRSNSGRGISTPNSSILSNSSKHTLSSNTSSSSTNNAARRSTPVKPSGSANYKYFVGLARDPQWTKERSSELMSLMMAQVSTGRDINATRRSTGETALHSVAEASEPWMVDLFLRLGANPSIESSMSHRTVLHKAAMNPNFKVAKMIWRQMLNTSISTGSESGGILSSPLLSADIKGLTPLHIACLSGNVLLLGYLLFEALDTLLRRHNIPVPGNFDSTSPVNATGPLTNMPTDNHRRNLLHALFEALPTSLSSDHFSAVQEITEKLISLGVDRFAKDDRHYTPLKHVLEKFGKTGAERPMGIISALLAGLTPKQVDKSIILVFKNDLGTPSASGLASGAALISNSDLSLSSSVPGSPGVRSNSSEVGWRDDWKPIQQAMQVPQYYPFLPLLISKVSLETLKYVDPNGRTIWHYMSLMGSQQKVIEYYKREFPPGSAQKTELDAESGVFIPFTHGHVNRIREHVDHCFQAILSRPDATELCMETTIFDRESQTPMHTAAKWNNVIALRRMSGMLGGDGTDIQACSELQQGWKDKEGWTALHTAVHFDTIFALCELHHLAWNLVPTDNQGRTPYMLAVEEKKRQSAELLKAWGGAPPDVSRSSIDPDPENLNLLSPRQLTAPDADSMGTFSDSASNASGSGSSSVSGSISDSVPSSMIVVEISGDPSLSSSEGYTSPDNSASAPTSPGGLLSPTSRKLLLHTASGDSLASVESAPSAGDMARPHSPIGRLRFQLNASEEDLHSDENDEEGGEDDEDPQEEDGVLEEGAHDGDEIDRQSVSAQAFLSALAAAKDREEDAAEEIERLRRQIQGLLQEQESLKEEIVSQLGEIKQLENALNARPTIKEHDQMQEKMDKALAQAAIAKNTVDEARSRIVTLELKLADLEEQEQNTQEVTIAEYKQNLQDSEEHILLLKSQLQEVQRELATTKEQLERTNAMEAQIATQLRRQLDQAQKEVSEFESYRLSTGEALKENEILVKKLNTQLSKLQEDAVELQMAFETANSRSDALIAELDALKASKSQDNASELESLTKSLEASQSSISATQAQLDAAHTRISELETEIERMNAAREDAICRVEEDAARGLQASNLASSEVSQALNDSQRRETELQESLRILETKLADLDSKLGAQNLLLSEAEHSLNVASEQKANAESTEAELRSELSQVEAARADLHSRFEAQAVLLLQVESTLSESMERESILKTKLNVIESSTADLKTKFEDQAARLQEAEAQLSLASQRNSDATQSEATLRSTLAKIEAEMTEVKSKLDSEHSSLQEARSQLAAAVESEAANKRIEKLMKDSLASLDIEKSKLILELESRQARLEESQRLLHEAQGRESELKRREAELKQEMISLEAEQALLKSNSSSEQNGLQEVQRLLSVSVEREATIKNLEQKLKETTEAMEDEKAKLKLDLDSRQTRLEESQRLLHEAQGRESELKRQETELKEQLASLETDLRKASSNLEVSLQEVSRVTSSLTSSEADAKRRESKLTDRVTSLEEHNDELKLQVDSQKEAILEAHHLVSLGEEREAGLKKENSVLEEHIGSLKREMAHIRESSQSVTSTSSQELEASLAVANERIKQNIEFLEHVQAEAARQHTADVENLQAAISASNALQVTLIQRESDLATVKNALAAAQSNASLAEGETEKYREAAVESSKELHAFRTLVEELRDQLKHLKEESSGREAVVTALPEEALETLFQRIVAELSRKTSSETDRCLKQLGEMSSRFFDLGVATETDTRALKEELRSVKESVNVLAASSTAAHTREVENLEDTKAMEELKNQVGTIGNSLATIQQLQQQQAQLLQQQQQQQQQQLALYAQQHREQMQTIGSIGKGASSSDAELVSSRMAGLTVYMALMTVLMFGMFLMMLKSAAWHSEPTFFPS